MARLVIFLAAFIVSLFWGSASARAQDPSAISSFTITAELITSGVVLKFPVSADLKNQLDHFLVWRTTGVSGDVSPSANSLAARLDYYHDWYKDYFYAGDLRQTFYYDVGAYDNSDRVIARGAPRNLPWIVREIPTSGLMLVPTAYRRVPMYDSASASVRRILPINLDITTIYFIGRIYGYNTLEELTNSRRVLFTRLGEGFIKIDVKVILEKEFMEQLPNNWHYTWFFIRQFKCWPIFPKIMQEILLSNS